MAISKSSSNSSVNPNSSLIYEQKQRCLLDALQQGDALLRSIVTQHEDGQCELELSNPVETVSPSIPSHRSRSLNRPLVASTNGVLKVLQPDGGENLADSLRNALMLVQKLRERLADRSSRILVTGDVNGGKSTFVNALLRSPHLMPVDQQPCTQAFCEIIPRLDSSPVNTFDQLIVHAIRDIDRYDPSDDRTFSVVPLAHMQDLIQTDDDQEPFQWYRMVYPLNLEERGVQLPLHSLSLSIIDSPGLNSDLFKTLAVFSKQEEIDVVVFLVNAANHLTLSAREFLERAGREKTMVFFCVNRMDDIRNAEKCRKAILAQIQEVSPASVDAGLVHFISAGRFLQKVEEEQSSSPLSVEMMPIQSQMGKADQVDFQEAFLTCEVALVSFLVHKRVESKLRPAHHFLSQLTHDLGQLFERKQQLLTGRLSKIQMELDMITPCYQQLMMHQEPLVAELEQIERESRQGLKGDLEREQHKFLQQADSMLGEIPWPGWWGLLGSGWKANVHSEMDALAKGMWQDGWTRGLQMALQGCRSMAVTGQQHARQLMGHGLTEVQIKRAMQPGVEIMLNHPSSLLDWSSLSIKSWMGAVSAAVGLWGWQSVGGMLVEVVRMVSGIRSRRVIGCLCLAMLGVGVGCLMAQDLEEGVRDRLLHHYRAELMRLSSSLHCDVEAGCASLMAQQRSSLLGRFEDALHQQRLLRAEKETQLGQQQACLERLSRHWQGLRGLQSQLQSFE